MRRPPNCNPRPSRSIVLAASMAVLLLGTSAHAHFLWLTAEHAPDSTVVHAFLSEPPVPDLPMFMKSIEHAKYTADGRELAAERGEETFLVRLPEPAPRAVDGACDLGVMSRGGATFRLQYTARVQLAPIPADEPEEGDGLRVRLVAEGGETRVLVSYDGRPAAGSEVKAYLEDGTVRELRSDGSGVVECEGVAEGKTALLAKWPDGKAGERDGESFEETRHYATLTVTPGGDDRPDEARSAASPSRGDLPFAPIPEPVNSFGGAVLGGHLYVYSGHTGTTHRYHTGTTNPHFYRLDLSDRTTWEELPCGPGLQGVALVAHDGALYRVGGMSARNAEGEPHDLVSVADVARFDPETRTWADLPPMPEPRSTHDAAVLGDHLYVVGGWAMVGGESSDAYFLDDALRLDLGDPSAGWERISLPPAPRRALAVAAHDGKLYMVGGLTEGGGTVRDVDVFDPATGAWSGGPELPGEPIQGFAPSAFSVGGRLLASGGDGTIYRLSESGESWEAIAEQAVPRITHRLLPGTEGDALIVGGNFAGVPVRFVESILISGGQGSSSPVAWSTSLPGSAMRSMAFGVIGNRIVLAGGNRSRNPHAFEAGNLVPDASRLLPDGSAAEPIAPLPVARQSGELVSVPQGRRGTGYLLGGIGQDGDVVRTLGDVFRLDPDGEGWSIETARIPDDRGMFGAAVHEGGVWIFGGSIFDPRPDDAPREMPTEVLRWEAGRDGATFEPTGHRLPTPRRSFAGAVLGGKYYLVGGLGEGQEPVDTVDVFDFETGEWESIPAPGRHRVFADLVALDGTLYLGGGFETGGSAHFEPARSVEAYDPGAGAWRTVIGDVPIRGRGIRMAAIGGRLLLFSAESADPGCAELAIVSPSPSPLGDGRAE
ncbi:kelch repeat-containing protein [Tautonia plasticadhaerens]|uniref:N-acetylneuraminate epimerase n=1 Tax=Tautonia plasticadhaerens TaxID=2527974 RepID=A0A518GXT6_9BACT|nr:kelch repeat-containing protein [Tautonia plasticadhaerens]QDV33414.1 N-acetylneuraminate epimerase precursor [Tautonia plasticadhaerens]